MTPAILADALRAQAAVLGALADALSAGPAPVGRWYTRRDLPPGVASWRAARERAAREGVATAKVGREVMIDRASWDASIEPRGRATVALADGDAAALATMGVVLPMRGAR